MINVHLVYCRLSLPTLSPEHDNNSSMTSAQNHRSQILARNSFVVLLTPLHEDVKLATKVEVGFYVAALARIPQISHTGPRNQAMVVFTGHWHHRHQPGDC